LRNQGRVAPDLGSWEAHEAHAEAVGEHKQAVADALQLSYSLIDRQCRPYEEHTDSGARTDEARIVTKVNALREKGVDENRAMLTVWWLLDALGYQRPAPSGGVIVTESELVTLAHAIRETGEFCAAAAVAMDSKGISVAQRKLLGKEAREARIALDNLILKLRLEAA
jgi:hypothetical protein